MSIAHNFMSILIHRAGFMSIARYEFYDNIGSMYELCSYYDGGFIMNELCSYISCMTFIMIPTLLVGGGSDARPPSLVSLPAEECQSEEYLSHTSRVAALSSFLVLVEHLLLRVLNQLKLPFVPESPPSHSSHLGPKTDPQVADQRL